MKLTITALLLLLSLAAETRAQRNTGDTITFDEWFEPKTLRVDYLLAGDSATETVFFVRMKQEPNYGGVRKNLTDPTGYGS